MGAITLTNRALCDEEPIVVFTTGGTIDKAYFDALSQYQVGETVVGKLLSIAQVTYPYRIVQVLRKDSLELTDEDRKELLRHIAATASSRILVTHGTDTMTETARFLAGVSDKTIVLTGALAPARFSESDATFNLGMAFAIAQTALPGIYVTMNGQVFRGDQVRKDRDNARFVRIHS